MENLTVTRTNCNTFVFSYSDTVKDLTINIREVSLISNWDGNLSLLPIYLTIVIPHVISPSIIPNTYTLELPSDKIYAFEYVRQYNWYLPSKDDLFEAFAILVPLGVGNLRTTTIDGELPRYWTSTEGVAGSYAWYINGATSLAVPISKNNIFFIRSVRDFYSKTIYTLGQETSSGFIFYIKDLGDGNFRYLELAKSDCEFKSNWSNLNSDDILDFIGTTTSGKFSGETNTNMIINQIGHTMSGALIATQYHIMYTTYSVYSVFCDLLTCRLDLLKRVLGELDNCKEECDCIAVYDYNAFSVIYEAIVSLYENIFNILNIDIENTTLTADEIETLTTFEELMIQYKKYCISCEKPCKNC